MAKMLKQAVQAQSALGDVKKKLAAQRFEGGAGGGAATATVSGDGRALELRFDPERAPAEDLDALGELAVAAFNEASTRAQESAAEQMSELASDMGLPGMPGL